RGELPRALLGPRGEVVQRRDLPEVALVVVGHVASRERDEVVVAELKDQEDRRVAAAVRDQMGTPRLHGIRLTGSQPDLLLGVPEEEAQAPLEDEERVLDGRVGVPRRQLARAVLTCRGPERR